MHPMFRYMRLRRPDRDDYYTEQELNSLLSYINAISPPPPGAQAADEGAAAMVEPESVDSDASPGISPASENSQPNQSGPSSENDAVPQLQTGNDVNTTLASQLASTTVTAPPVNQQSQIETSSSVETPVVSSNLPEPGNRPPLVGSENEASGSKPSVMDSDIGESETRPAVPRVIVRDIVELGDGQSVVMPNEADLQILQEQTGKPGQKRKVEDESESESAADEGAAAMVEPESVDSDASPGISPASENSQPNQSGPSSENDAVPQLQTGNDVNTTLASQLASTTVTAPPVNQQSQIETSSSVETPVVSSNLPEPGNRPPLVGSENEASGSKPSVMDSDIGESETRPAVPRVIVRDIVELGDGQSVVMPNEADLQILQEQTGKPGQKRKVEDESESESETAPSPKEQKRDEEGSDEEKDEENKEVEIEAEDRALELQDQADIVQRVLHLFRKYKRDGIPTSLEQQLLSMRMSPLQYVYNQVNEIDRWRNMEPLDPYDPEYYLPGYYMQRERGGPGGNHSDEDSGQEDTTVDKAAPAKFPLTNEQRLMRLLIFGGVSKAMSSRMEPDKNEINSIVHSMIEEGNGEHVVDLLKEISTSGRSARQDSLLYVLSRCCRSTDMKTKQAAYAAIQDICRIPTHMFELITHIEGAGSTSGWGRGLRHAVAKWYNKKANNPQYLAMHITKYGNRLGWTHRDVFRLAHIKPVNDAIGFIVRFAVKGMKDAEQEFLQDGYLGREELEKVHKYLKAVEEAKTCQEASRTVQLIKEFDLVREHLATQMLNEPGVWSIMLPKMPLHALLRNLNKMTNLGLFEVPENLEVVVSKLQNTEAMKKAKVHPLKLLVAHRIYERGRGEKGNLEWQPHPKIVETLEEAFYASFGLVESTNKRILIALDISGSMCGNLGDHPISMREAATVMAMVTIKREPACDVVGFHHRLIPLEMFKDTTKTMKQLVDDTSSLGFGATDCSKPMTWARKQRKEYDAFIIYTDCETNHHRIPPYAALQKYRDAMNIPTAKLVVVGMMNYQFSIAEPNDIYMLDVLGFDPDCPEMIRQFLVEGVEW